MTPEEMDTHRAIAKALIPFPERYAKEEDEVTDMDGDLNSSNWILCMEIELVRFQSLCYDL